jgi:hypothetical protein
MGSQLENPASPQLLRSMAADCATFWGLERSEKWRKFKIDNYSSAMRLNPGALRCDFTRE